jgi:tetratricopeptide (TPR) repeat protein
MHFLKVLAETNDPAMRNLTRAHLGQTYAMWMIPNEKQKNAVPPNEKAATYAHIQRMFDQSYRCSQLVRQEIPERVDGLWIKIAATADNAAGMAYMYLSDYPVSAKHDKGPLLQVAVENLYAADKRLPHDWANTCDLGSLHLRLGILQREKGNEPDVEFERAKDFLEIVVTTLRPNYGFALYELGRLHRIWSKWDRAIDYLDRSLKISEQYRDVSTIRVETEKARAISRDDRYLSYLPLCSDVPKEHWVA